MLIELCGEIAARSASSDNARLHLARALPPDATYDEAMFVDTPPSYVDFFFFFFRRVTNMPYAERANIHYAVGIRAGALALRRACLRLPRRRHTRDTCHCRPSMFRCHYAGRL